jgi:hypothetical protein
VSRDQNGGARFAQFAPVVDPTFDLLQVLRFSVGPDWSTMNADHQQHTYCRYSVSTRSRASSPASTSRATRFRITGERQAAEETIIGITIGGHKIELRHASDSFRLAHGDVLADGTISRIATQRSNRGGGPVPVATRQRKVSDLWGGSIA